MDDETPLDVILSDDYLRAMYDTAYGHIAKHLAVSPGPVLEVGAGQGAVSYTHLTLPTILLV